MQIKSIHDLDLTWLVDKIGGCDLKTGPWISGSAARKLWFGQPWKTTDVDVFFNNGDNFLTATNTLERRIERSDVWFPWIVNKVASRNIKPNKPKYETKNAVTYSIIIGSVSTNVVNVQLIRKKWYESLEDVWSTFDFTVCKFATDGKFVVADTQAIEDCQQNLLRINFLADNKLNVRRVIKYSLYGFDADAEIMQEILYQKKNDTLLFEVNQTDDDYS